MISLIGYRRNYFFSLAHRERTCRTEQREIAACHEYFRLGGLKEAKLTISCFTHHEGWSSWLSGIKRRASQSGGYG